MTISDVIERVRRLKSGYDIDDEQIISNINTVEMLLLHTVVEGRQGDTAMQQQYGGYDLTTARDTQLMVPPPFDTIYEACCAAQIDLAQEDLERYRNDCIVFENARADFARHWYKTHRQRGNFPFRK